MRAKRAREGIFDVDARAAREGGASDWLSVRAVVAALGEDDLEVADLAGFQGEGRREVGEAVAAQLEDVLDLRAGLDLDRRADDDHLVVDVDLDVRRRDVEPQPPEVAEVAHLAGEAVAAVLR